MKLAFLVGRLVFGGFFAFNGIHHLLDVGTLEGYAASRGVPMPQLAVIATGLMILVGGLSIMLGAWPRIGAALIVVFLLGVTFAMHDFWAIDDPQGRAMQVTQFSKNLALLGGALALFAVPRPWPYSIDSSRLHRPAEVL